MTVCIAAIAEKGKNLVLVSDRMITANIPIAYQYETDDVTKIYELTDFSVAMIAGNALFAHEIVTNSLRKIKDNNSITIEQIAEIVRDEYVLYRTKLITRDVLEPRGLTLDTYIEKQQKLAMGVVGDIENKLIGFNIGVDMIIAGHNKGECHIFSIVHPGQLISNDAMSFACVGIGAPHALYYLIDSDYKRTLDLEKARKIVNDAKVKSEKAPGVGRQTYELILPKKNAK
jgi:20S proteasome alpha/beta subunit